MPVELPPDSGTERFKTPLNEAYSEWQKTHYIGLLELRRLSRSEGPRDLEDFLDVDENDFLDNFCKGWGPQDFREFVLYINLAGEARKIKGEIPGLKTRLDLPPSATIEDIVALVIKHKELFE